MVTWLDHTADASWRSEEEVKKSKPCEALTVGWLVHEDDLCMKLCNTRICDGWGGEDLIIKSCIINVEEVIFDSE